MGLDCILNSAFCEAEFKMLALLLSLIAAEELATRIMVNSVKLEVTSYDGLTYRDDTSNSWWGGAAIHIEKPREPTGSLRLSNCHFYNMISWGNTVEQTKVEQVMGGGAIFMWKMGLICTFCHFEDCLTKCGRAGAILCFEESETEVDHCHFVRCASDPKHLPQVGGGGVIAVMSDPLKLVADTFEDCYCTGVQSGGAVMFNWNEPASLLNITSCQFFNCSAKLQGTLWAGRGDVVLLNCTFSDCRSTTSSSAVMDTDIHKVTSIDIQECKFVDCTGTPAKAVLSLLADTLVFRGNTFDLHLKEGKYYALVLGFRTLTQETVILVQDCNFTNNGETLQHPHGTGGIVKFNVSNANQVQFDNCSFYDIKSTGFGGALNVDLRLYGLLTLTMCNFTNIHTQKCGAVVPGYYVPLYFAISNCRFEDCSAAEIQDDAYAGAAISVREQTKGGVIQDCTFINNSAADGQSIQCYFVPGTLYPIQIVGCSFEEHKSEGIISMRWAGDQSIGVVTYTLTNCSFKNNKLGALNGGELLFRGVLNWQITGIVFDGCKFIDNTVENGVFSVWMASLTSGHISAKFTKCDFEGIKSTSSGVISVTGFPNTLGSLLFDDCNFINCNSETSCPVLESSACSDVGFAQCEFVGCTSQAKKACIDVSGTYFRVNGLTYLDNSGVLGRVSCSYAEISVLIIETTWQTEAVFSLDLKGAETETVIQHVTLNVSGQTAPQNGVAPMHLTVAETAKVQFERCCFRGVDDARDVDVPYLEMTLDGTVELTDMCFDRDENSSLAVSGKGTIQYNGEKEDFFVECFCSAHVYTDIVTDPPHGDGGKSGLGGGEIAAIVIVLLLLIAAAILLIFFFVIRRRRANTSSEQGQEPTNEDEPEVTITTMTTDAGNPEWGVVTEENNVFAAPSQDVGNDPFSHLYEEEQMA